MIGIKANIGQRPVGQGGLCRGSLKAFAANGQSEVFRWIYDCGSNQIDALKREIFALNGKRQDFLFLSHLDADHINGVDALLANCKEPREVVLPYLNDDQRLWVLGESASAGTATGSFLDFLGDTTAWFQKRGVARVTHVRSPDEDGQVDGTSRRADPSPEPGEFTAKWTVAPKPLPEVPTVMGVDNGAAIVLTGHAEVADWTFLPYTQVPPREKVRAFKDRLAAIFPGKPVGKIIDEARTASGRKALRDAYDALYSHHNNVSMSLYMGPLQSGLHKWRNEVFFTDWDWMRVGTGSVGWLVTGDADLKSVGRRNAFLRFYADYLPNVDVFGLPHHGAATSFHPPLLNEMKAVRFVFAAAGPNRWGHPHAEVTDAVATDGSRFIHVNEEAGKALEANLYHNT